MTQNPTSHQKLLIFIDENATVNFSVLGSLIWRKRLLPDDFFDRSRRSSVSLQCPSYGLGILGIGVTSQAEADALLSFIAF
jgi:hypothetical protein